MHKEQPDLHHLLQRLQTLNNKPTDTTLDTVFWDWMTNNFNRVWYRDIAYQCHTILKNCGQQDFAEKLMRFANHCQWTADDTKTKYTGFRTSSNVYTTKEQWKAVEVQLRAYQQTLSKTNATFEKIEYVLNEMDRYMKHYRVSEWHTWSS